MTRDIREELAQVILRLSSISPADEEQIRLAVWVPKFPCARNCSGYGHSEDSPLPICELRGKRYHRYPAHLVAPQTYLWLQWYGHFKSGFLPVAGGLLDQSKAFLDAMTIIREEVAELNRTE